MKNAAPTKTTVRRMLWLPRSWSLNWKKWANISTVARSVWQRQQRLVVWLVLCSLHRQAWLDERFSPELLENKSEVVECVMEQLTHMVNSQGNTCCCCSRKCQRALWCTATNASRHHVHVKATALMESFRSFTRHIRFFFCKNSCTCIYICAKMVGNIQQSSVKLLYALSCIVKPMPTH